jgi:hypothetical protein
MVRSNKGETVRPLSGHAEDLARIARASEAARDEDVEALARGRPAEAEALVRAGDRVADALDRLRAALAFA